MYIKIFGIKKNSIFLAATVLATSIVLVQPVYASSEAGGHHAGFSSIATQVVNFFVFVTVIFFLVRKAFNQAWERRVERISDEVNRAARELEKANSDLEDSKARQKNIGDVQEQLTKEILAIGNREVFEIEKATEIKISRIKDDFESKVSQEKYTSAKLLREEYVELVSAKAKEMLKGSVDSIKDADIRRKQLGSIKDNNIIH